MDMFLLAAVVIIATALAGWFYWQTQKTEQRIAEIALRLADQSAQVGELVDEVILASQHLYREMDRWQSLVDTELLHRSQPATALPGGLPDPAPEATAPVAPLPVEVDYSPHLHALKMATEGNDPVTIARDTGIGLEELRPLLSFQEAINAPATADSL